MPLETLLIQSVRLQPNSNNNNNWKKMASGTISSIKQDSINTYIDITVGGSVYSAVIPTVNLTSLATDLDRLALLITLFTGIRRSNRRLENSLATIQGAVIAVPD